MSLASLANPVTPASDKIARLRDRAALLRQVRDFFHHRDVLEVDCPLLSAQASIDAHIDLISALYRGQEIRYLHSSPEFGMKRLLAEGMEDIYQLSHVFRDGERGVKHNPEFMMAEWYRLDFTLEELIQETIELMALFLGQLPFTLISYRAMFQRYAGFDYLTMSEEDLMHYIESHHIPSYPTLKEEGKDALLNLILGYQIEPLLGQQELCVLAYYPASQAALAQKRWHEDEQVAERFEVYYQGIELANGYHELTDAAEQRQRFVEANQTRLALGKQPLPIDENFLMALEKGLPNCCGVAVGFDRLMMLRQKQSHIDAVIPWGWNLA